MSSRVNILVSFKIYSKTDTYYLVGSSNAGSFTHKLGKGWSDDGSPDLYHSRIDASEIGNLESNGFLVSKVVPLGEKYGDYRMRMYAENELGIRSAYVELDKVIPAPDIDGTFRFNSIYVDRLTEEKPSAYSVVRKSPRRAAPTLELDNSLVVESEFVGRSALIKWDLKAPYGFTGSPKGTVVQPSNIDLFESLFSHFEIYFYKENPEEKISTQDDVNTPPVGSAVFDSELPVSEVGQIVDLSFDKRVGEKIIDEDNFEVGFSKNFIENLMGDGERFIYIKVVGKDIFYNSADDKYMHRFSGVIKVENTRSRIEEAFADLYGNQMTLSYVNRDRDFQGGKVILRSFTSQDNTTWVHSDSAVLNSAGASNVFKQKWSSPTNRNYYKYILEIHDAYGFCGYHSISSKGVLKDFFTKKLTGETQGEDTQEKALDVAIADSYAWQSERKIGSISIKENGSSFDVSWSVVDSQGHLINPPAPSRDSSGVPIFTMGDRIEIEDLAGFTVDFKCPDEYINSGNSFPVRDAFDLGILGIESEDQSGNKTYKAGSPDNSSGQLLIPETIGITDGVLTAENQLSINLDTSIQLTKEENADLYRSWFNDLNYDDVPANSEFRVLYKENNNANVGSYKNKGFYAVDAQRRIKLAVSLIDSEGRIIDTKISEGYNAPPRILVKQGLSSDPSSVSSASVRSTDLVEFKLSLNEKTNTVGIFRRPVEVPNQHPVGHSDFEDKYYGVGGESNVDKTRVDDPDHAKPISVYNSKDLDYFAEGVATSADVMLYGFGVEMDRWVKDDDPEDFISNAEYVALPDDAEAMVDAGASNHKKQYVRFEVTGRNISNVGEGGFFTAFIDSKGNRANSDSFGTKNFLAGGRVIGSDNSITIIDQPPLIREQGLLRRKAPGTQYDYMLLPFDSFGTGEAWLPDRVNFYGGVLFSQDENGAIGTLDFDTPFPPEGLQIKGANKTFFMEWQPPAFEAGDVDFYNLYYINDSRSETDRLGLGGADTRIADGDILRFNKDEYVHEDSEFHAMDLDFQAENNNTFGSVVPWENETYSKNHYVKSRPRGDSSKAFRLYKSNAATTASDIPGKSNLWDEQVNVQLWENGTAVHRDDVKFNERASLPEVDGGGGSQTFSLIYYSSFKTYNPGQIAFRDNKCYICTGVTTGNFNAQSWSLVEGVSIEEIKIPITETSLTVVADTNDKAYFFFESVDRIQNRSKLHVDPTKPESETNEYTHQLGKSTLKDIDNFEQELSAEFPNAIMLRPSDPFEIVDSENYDNAKIKWKGHYLYNDGYGYFIPSGEMFLRSDTTHIKDKAIDSSEFIRYIYWNPRYGYNTNASSWTERITENTTVRENQLPYRKKSGHDEAPTRISSETFDELQQTRWVAKANSSVTAREVFSDPGGSDYYEWSSSMYEEVPAADRDTDSSLSDKESDTDIDYRAYYSFSTGNPASQIYNRRQKNTDHWLSDPIRSSVIWDELNKDTDVIHETAAPVGFGTFGLHITRSESIKTNQSPEGNVTDGLLEDGGFQICRIDNIDGEYSHTINFEVFNNATIGQANISNATITSAQITDLSADRITAGIIGSHRIQIGNALIPEVTDGSLGDAQDDSHNGGPGRVGPDGSLQGAAADDAYTNSKYAYGSITSQGFDHTTQGKPGFFISGDGQFGFQTTNGGIYLRGGLDSDRNQDNSPTQLVIRGTLIQENSDPFVKMEMSSSVQNLSFNEHAENHFYYEQNGKYNIYGTETSVLRPSNGEVTVSYNIQNAYHTDGSPYDIDELQLIMYVDGDPSRTIDQKDVFKLIKSSALPTYQQRWVLKSLWHGNTINRDSTLLAPNQILTSDPNDSSLYEEILVQESSVHGECLVNGSVDSTRKNKTACDNNNGAWVPVVRDTGPNLGLNDIDDLNKGGSITFDFVGGRYGDTAELVDSEPSMVFFTGAPINNPSDIISRIEEEDLNDVGENPGSTLIPIADSVTIVLRMISRAPVWSSTQTYLAGELVNHGGKVWRSVHSGSNNKDQTPSSSSTYWDEEPAGEVIVEEKSVTIFRKDQPTNLASIDLVSTGSGIIRNSNNNETVTVKPVLTHGATQYSLEHAADLEDWMKTLRSQMAIYQGPPNLLKQNKYKLLTSGKTDFPSDNTSFSVTLKNEDVLEGKTTLYLVDTKDNSNWPDARDSLDVYKEVATIDVLDVNDGVDVGYIDLAKDDKFYTREYLIRPKDTSGAVEYQNSYKLESIGEKAFNATIRITSPDDRELSKDIVVKIKNVALGKYIEKKDITIEDKDGNTICSFASNAENLAPVMVPFTLDNDIEVPKQSGYDVVAGNSADDLKKTGVGRVYFSVDNKQHVTEIVIRFDFIKTRGNTIAVIGSDNETSSTHYKANPLGSVKTWGDTPFSGENFTFTDGMVSQISAEENILINTLIRPNPSFRLSLTKPYISYSRNTLNDNNQVSNQALLRRSENIIPIQLYMGEDNITDEVDNNPGAVAEFSMDVIPTFGFVVSYEFLNGTNNDGECWPDSKTAARNAINDLKSEGIEEGVYYHGSEWKIADSDGSPITADSNFLYYIPPRLSDLPGMGNSKIKIKASYTRTNVPVASSGLRDKSNGAFATDVFTDIETINVVETLNGESAPFAIQTNETVAVEVNPAGKIIKAVSETTFDSEVRVKVADDDVALLNSSDELLDGFRLSTGSNRIIFESSSAKSIANNTTLTFRNSGGSGVKLYDFDGSEIKIKTKDGSTASVKYISMFDETDSSLSGMPSAGHTLAFFDSSDEVVASCKMPKIFKHGIALLVKDQFTDNINSQYFAANQEWKKVASGDKNDTYVISDFMWGAGADDGTGSKQLIVGDTIMNDSGQAWFGSDANSDITVQSQIEFYATSRNWRTEEVVSTSVSRQVRSATQGETGATIVYRSGRWTPSTQYIGTTKRREVVRFSDGKYYITTENASVLAFGAQSLEALTQTGDLSFDALYQGENDSGNAATLNSWKKSGNLTGSNQDITEKRLSPEFLGDNVNNVAPVWEEFGVQVESVATNLLLAHDVRVHRGIVAGLDDATEGFFASQIDITHLDANGDYKYGYDARPGERAVSIKIPDNPIHHGAFAHTEFKNENGVSVTLPEYQNLTPEQKERYTQLDITGTEHANSAEVAYLLGDSDYDAGHPFNPTLTTTWKVPFTNVPGFFIGYHRLAYDLSSDPDTSLQKDYTGFSTEFAETFNSHLPMMEFRSHTGNFLRWDGLRLEMYGSVINGSVNPSNISISLGISDSIRVFSDQTLYSGQIFCGGGFNNYLPDSLESLGSAIVGGGANRIYGKFSAIAGGYGNSIHGAFSFIGSGFGNVINTGATTLLGYSSEVSGTEDMNKKFSEVSTGSRDDMIKGFYQEIFNRDGSANDRSIWSSSAIAGDWTISQLYGIMTNTDEYWSNGMRNKVDVGWGSSSGGEKIEGNNISNPFNAIVTGKGNSIIDSKYSIIGSGFGNIIDNSQYSSILNGQGNAITHRDSGARRGSSVADSGIYITNVGTTHAKLGDGTNAMIAASDRSGETMYQGLSVFNNLKKKEGGGNEGWYIVNKVNVNKEDGDFDAIDDDDIDASSLMIYDNGDGWYLMASERRFNAWVDNGRDPDLKFGRWIYIPAISGPYFWCPKHLAYYSLKTGPSDILLTAAESAAQEGVTGDGQYEWQWVVFSEENMNYHTFSESTIRSQKPGFLPDLELLNFVDMSLPVDDKNGSGRFGYNTIAGGSRNLINRSSNSALIGSANSYVSDLKNAVVGGMTNRVFGSAVKVDGNGATVSRMVKDLQKGVTVFGSENIFDVRDVNWAYDDLMSAVVGSQNTIIGCRKSVILGTGNQLKGGNKPIDSSGTAGVDSSGYTSLSGASTPTYYNISGTEVNILGTNNVIRGSNLFARNLSIFGSNFVLTSQEQIVNSYYIGNPFPAGGLLTRLFVAADGGAYFTGDVVSFALSDEKYKDNVQLISDPIKKIKGIRGVSFDWNDQQEVYQGHDVGVIAQEVESVFPEVVETRKTGKAVKYEKLTPLLIEAVKSQQEQIESLKKCVEELTSTIDKLKQDS